MKDGKIVHWIVNKRSWKDRVLSFVEPADRGDLSLRFPQNTVLGICEPSITPFILRASERGSNMNHTVDLRHQMNILQLRNILAFQSKLDLTNYQGTRKNGSLYRGGF